MVAPPSSPLSFDIMPPASWSPLTTTTRPRASSLTSSLSSSEVDSVEDLVTGWEEYQELPRPSSSNQNTITSSSGKDLSKTKKEANSMMHGLRSPTPPKQKYSTKVRNRIKKNQRKSSSSSRRGAPPQPPPQQPPEHSNSHRTERTTGSGSTRSSLSAQGKEDEDDSVSLISLSREMAGDLCQLGSFHIDPIEPTTTSSQSHQEIDVEFIDFDSKRKKQDGNSKTKMTTKPRRHKKYTNPWKDDDGEDGSSSNATSATGSISSRSSGSESGSDLSSPSLGPEGGTRESHYVRYMEGLRNKKQQLQDEDSLEVEDAYAVQSLLQQFFPCLPLGTSEACTVTKETFKCGVTGEDEFLDENFLCGKDPEQDESDQTDRTRSSFVVYEEDDDDAEDDRTFDPSIMTGYTNNSYSHFANSVISHGGASAAAVDAHSLFSDGTNGSQFDVHRARSLDRARRSGPKATTMQGETVAGSSATTTKMFQNNSDRYNQLVVGILDEKDVEGAGHGPSRSSSSSAAHLLTMNNKQYKRFTPAWFKSRNKRSQISIVVQPGANTTTTRTRNRSMSGNDWDPAEDMIEEVENEDEDAEEETAAAAAAAAAEESDETSKVTPTDAVELIWNKKSRSFRKSLLKAATGVGGIGGSKLDPPSQEPKKKKEDDPFLNEESASPTTGAPPSSSSFLPISAATTASPPRSNPKKMVSKTRISSLTTCGRNLEEVDDDNEFSCFLDDEASHYNQIHQDFNSHYPEVVVPAVDNTTTTAATATRKRTASPAVTRSASIRDSGIGSKIGLLRCRSVKETDEDDDKEISTNQFQRRSLSSSPSKLVTDDIVVKKGAPDESHRNSVQGSGSGGLLLKGRGGVRSLSRIGHKISKNKYYKNFRTEKNDKTTKKKNKKKKYKGNVAVAITYAASADDITASASASAASRRIIPSFKKGINTGRLSPLLCIANKKKFVGIIEDCEMNDDEAIHCAAREAMANNLRSSFDTTYTGNNARGDEVGTGTPTIPCNVAAVAAPKSSNGTGSSSSKKKKNSRRRYLDDHDDKTFDDMAVQNFVVMSKSDRGGNADDYSARTMMNADSNIRSIVRQDHHPSVAAARTAKGGSGHGRDIDSGFFTITDSPFSSHQERFFPTQEATAPADGTTAAGNQFDSNERMVFGKNNEVSTAAVGSDHRRRVTRTTVNLSQVAGSMHSNSTSDDKNIIQGFYDDEDDGSDENYSRTKINTNTTNTSTSFFTENMNSKTDTRRQLV